MGLSLHYTVLTCAHCRVNGYRALKSGKGLHLRSIDPLKESISLSWIVNIISGKMKFMSIYNAEYGVC